MPRLTEARADLGIRLLPNPEHCPGGYALHLYCRFENPAHGWREFPWHISEYETGPRSRAAARKSGWILHRDGTATCPKCAKALRADPAGRSALAPQSEEQGGRDA